MLYGLPARPDFIVWKLHLSSSPRQVYQVLARHWERMPVTLSPFASLRGNSAKDLARRMQRSFAALRMTRLDLSIGEELSRSFEPCLIRKYS